MATRRVSAAARHRALLDSHRHLYDELLAFQGGHCALCPRPPSERRRLDLDHHHKTMVVRGLLCVPCNRNLPDWVTPEWLRATADYLEDPPLARLLRQKGLA